MARARPLSPADAAVWAAFGQTVPRLLPGRTRPVVAPDPPPAAPSPQPPAAPRAPKQASKPVDVDIAPAGLDKATWHRFAGAKLRATRKLDLHGHTAARAHHAVTAFIERAYAEQERCVEIVTGKGAVLARELPLWLNAAPLRKLILAIAHPHAANTGAIRILLRRNR